MFALFTYLNRTYKGINPPPAPKKDDALRFGILGAAKIGPMAFITPAISSSDVIVAAVAARDRKRAEAYAKKHNIPNVHDTYDDLIADPTLDCIYNPLPNGLHYEWTLKALKVGKHVLLEKPSTSNAEEARALFYHPLFNEPNAPVLLEAFHYRFHPAWQTFLTLFSAKDVEEVEVLNSLFQGMFPRDDIRFKYSLSGGGLMDLGTYALSAIRSIFGDEPSEVLSATYRALPEGFDEKCEEAIYASYRFPNGGTAKITSDLQATGGWWFPFLTKNWPNLRDSLPSLRMKLKVERGVDGGLEKRVRREFVFTNYMAPHLYHRIDVITVTEWRQPGDGKVVKTEKNVEYKKVYNWLEPGEGRAGEEWFTTYRCQLEEFVNRVKKRKGSGVWIEADDSVKQMELIDATYAKTGLPLRPTSEALGKV